MQRSLRSPAPSCDAQSVEASRAWLLRQCSKPHIFFWYIRVAGAGFLTYLVALMAARLHKRGRYWRLLLPGSLVVYRLLRRPRQLYRNVPDDFKHAFDKLSQQPVKGRFITRDGVDIAYGKLGSGPKLVLLANGLGCSEIYWIHALQYFDSIGASSEYTVVTWDYRGLFNSGDLPENRTAKFSIRDHAEDGLELLSHLNCEHYFTALGWSTGVQVVLEIASIKPSAVGRLVLLNGTHGHLMQTLLQPTFKVPGMGLSVHLLIRFLTPYKLLPAMVNLMRRLAPYSRMFFIQPSAFMLGLNYEAFIYNYYLDLLSHGQRHLTNYLKLACCLDAHSCFHTLDEIAQPTLVIAGMLDFITPAFHSFLIAARMPNAKLICYNMGSHFCGLEYHEDLARMWHAFGKLPLNNFWEVNDTK